MCWEGIRICPPRHAPGWTWPGACRWSDLVAVRRPAGAPAPPADLRTADGSLVQCPGAAAGRFPAPKAQGHRQGAYRPCELVPLRFRLRARETFLRLALTDAGSRARPSGPDRSGRSLLAGRRPRVPGPPHRDPVRRRPSPQPRAAVPRQPAGCRPSMLPAGGTSSSTPTTWPGTSAAPLARSGRRCARPERTLPYHLWSPNRAFGDHR